MKNGRFSAEEIDKLTTLVQNGLTDEEISKELQRNVKSIINKRTRLGARHVKNPGETKKGHYSPDEDLTIKRMTLSGHTDKEISIFLNRQEKSVINRRTKLGIRKNQRRRGHLNQKNNKCMECGKPILPKKKNKKTSTKRKFCNHVCRWKYWNQEEKKARKTKIAKGFCICCSKKIPRTEENTDPKTKTRYKKCIECRKRHQHNRKAKILTGLCYTCGKPRNGYKGNTRLCEECHKKGNAESTSYHQRKRQLFLTMYGGKCACCGEDFHMFLCLDHVNNDGNMRRGWRNKTGGGCAKELSRAIQEYNPDEFQILCYNCNMAKHINKGRCPCQDGPTGTSLHTHFSTRKSSK